MKNENMLKQLELEHKQLVHATRLPDSILTIPGRNSYKHFDLAFARDLIGKDQPWGADDAFDPKNRVISDVFMGSDEGKKLFYASENDLLRKARETAADQDHQGPFGICESVFPVRVRGNVIHLIRTGKYRTTAFNEKDLQELCFLCNVPMTTVRQAVAGLPIYTPEQADDLKRTHARLRDGIKLALREHMRLMEVTAQQLHQERLSSLGSLSEGMAHHFNDILSVILAYSSMLIDRAEVKSGELDMLRKISESAQRGRRFTREILSLSDSFAEEEAVITSLHDRLQGSITLIQSRFKSGIVFDVHFNAANDRITAPPGIIHHLAFNAISSAAESITGNGRLSITTENADLEDAGRKIPGIRVLIKDTAGTAAPRNQMVTTPEAETESESAPKIASLLGMVASLDGHAETRTEADGSTILEIALPVVTTADEAAPQKKIRKRLAPSRIWVADDEAVVCEMCRRVLTEEQHAVVEFGSGEEFMNKYSSATEPPELVIYDFGMPDHNGLEMCKWLRDQGHRTPVIFITGYNPEHPEIKKALKMRKTFLLQKPFSYRDMADLVTIALGETLIEEIPATEKPDAYNK